MRINGRAIASKILKGLKNSISRFSLQPALAIILAGENPASISYIKQKQKAAKFIGAKIILKKLPKETTLKNLNKMIGEFNENPSIHGVIVQLPLPEHLNPCQILSTISSKKDIDGFQPNSAFTPPVAKAVLKVLEEIQKPKELKHLGGDSPGSSPGGSHDSPEVREMKFLIIGRGITAGKPIVETLNKLGYKISVSHSKTMNLAGLAKKADVIISCVGKAEIVKPEMLRPGALVIGVGIHREPDHLRGENRAQLGGAPPAGGVDTSKVKLVGDFNEEKISKLASFYTPTPGGIGPLTVACLMENLVKASQKNS